MMETLLLLLLLLLLQQQADTAAAAHDDDDAVPVHCTDSFFFSLRLTCSFFLYVTAHQGPALSPSTTRSNKQW